MASYNLVLNTRFRPFSYQEMLAPVAAATQAHQAIEEMYGDLSTKANVWEGIANEQTDPYAYKMYKTYAEDLEAQAAQLAKEGLTPGSRRNMLGMRARYSSEITPIEVAYKRREELAKEQRAALASNPTLRYQRYARSMSLDDLIKNPSLDYGESYSGALLAQQVSQAAANFQKVLTGKSNLKALGLPYQYERMIQYGATPAQVMAAMGDAAQQGEPGAVKFLRGIVDQVIQSSGVADWADEATMKEFRAFANQGLYSALGQAKIDNFTDQFSMQDAVSRRSQQRQWAHDAAKASQQPKGRSKLNPRSLLSSREMKDKEALKYSKYFRTDPRSGKFVLNEAGKKEYNRGAGDPKAAKAAGDIVGSILHGPLFGPLFGSKIGDFSAYVATRDKSNFRKFMDSLNPNLQKAETAFQNLYSNAYDAHQSTEYVRTLNNEYGSEFFNQMKGAAGSSGLQTVEYQGPDKGFVPVKDLTSEQLKGYSVASVNYSKYGDTAILTGNGLPTLRVKVPVGLSISNQSNVMNSIQQADIYGDIVNTGRAPEIDNQGRVKLDSKGNVVYTNERLTPNDILYFQGLQEEWLDNMNIYGSQYVVPSKTETETYGIFN